MEPLTIFIGWEAAIIIVVVVNLTSAFKDILDWSVGGREVRDSKPVLRFLLKLLPPILGGIVATVLPVRPSMLIEYVKDYELDIWGIRAVYGGWGMVLGTFASAAYGRIRGFLQARGVSLPRGDAKDPSEEK